MNPVPISFVDTSGWYAHLTADDANHAAAQRFMRASSGTLATTNYVIDETITLMWVRVGHSAAERGLRGLCGAVEGGWDADLRRSPQIFSDGTDVG